MGDYRKLLVWERAHLLTLGVYRVTSGYPQHELYGLVGQTRRAAASVAMNIAEGCGRGSDGELRRFLRIALGSANELDYQLLLGSDLGYLEKGAFEQLAHQNADVRRMLSRLASRVGKSRSN